MKISENTTSQLLDIKEFSGNKLKNEQDICLLIEASAGNKKLLADTAFTAKYLNGLGKIMHSRSARSGSEGSPAPLTADAEDKVRNEFKQSIMKLTLQLSEITNDIPAEDKKSFEDKYLAMNQASLINLTTLIYDLSWVKNYLNSKK